MLSPRSLACQRPRAPRAPSGRLAARLGLGLLLAAAFAPPAGAQPPPPPPPQTRVLDLSTRPPQTPPSAGKAAAGVDGPVVRRAQTDKFNGIFQRTPDDCVPLATGKVLVLNIFVRDSTTQWTDSPYFWDNDKDAMLGYCKDACDWLADEAPGSAGLQFSNHGNPFTSYTYNVTLTENVPNSSEKDITWIDRAVGTLYGDYDGSGSPCDDLIEAVLASYFPDYEWGLITIHVNKNGRSYALPWDNATSIYPRDSLGQNEWGSVFAHEMLHLFGTDDEYKEKNKLTSVVECPQRQCDEDVPNNWLDWLYKNGNCESCSDHDAKCIMRDTSRSWTLWIDNSICTYTKGQIGWRDGDGDGKRDFQEAKPFSWISTPNQSTTEDDILVQGRAWTPFAHIDSVAYQVGNVVNSANWSYVAAPYDGAWDEHEEAVNITIPLPSDGSYKVWLKAHNTNGCWQDSALDSCLVTRDTTGPTAPSVWASPNYNPNLWYNTPLITVYWSGSTDASGVAGYGYTIDIYNNTYAPETNMGLSGYTVYSPAGTGVWYAHVAAVDNLGNWGPTTHFRLRVDSTAPTTPDIQSSSHQQLVWSNDNGVDFSWSSSDAQSKVRGYGEIVDSSPNTTVSGPSIGTGTSMTYYVGDGISYLHVAAVDSAGNWSATAHYQVRVQTTPPAAPVPYLANPQAGQEWYKVTGATCGWSAPSCLSGIAGYSVTLADGTSGAPPDSTIDTTQLQREYTGLASGRHTFGIRAKDNAGNWSGAAYLTFGLDTSPPAAVTNLATTSHAHAVGQFHRDESANPYVTITFDPAVDAHSGLANHAILWDTNPGTTVTFQNAQVIAQNTTIVSPSLTTGNWYAHVGSVDHKENWTGAGQTAHLGPIVIDITPPPAPTNLYVTSGSSRVDLSWWQVRNERVDHYIVYRSDDADLLGAALTSTLRDTVYADLTPANGDVYYYRVAAVDSVSLVSEPSDQATGRPEYVSPGQGNRFANLDALVAASQGGARDDGAGGYTLHGNVTISAGDTLDIQPGSRLRSVDRTGTRRLIITGTLRSLGTPGSPILIEATWARPGAWGGIAMNPPSPGCAFAYTTIRHGKTDVLWYGDSPTFSYCTASDAENVGLDLQAGVGATCTVQHCTVDRCGGNGVNVVAPAFTTSDIGWNTLASNQDGIYWTTIWPGNPPTILNIHDNTVTDNTGDGIACGFGAGASTVVQNNTVLNNSRGIVFDGEGWNLSTPVIQNNLVTANAAAGIYVSQMAKPDLLANRIVSNPQFGVRSTQDGQPRLRDNVIQGSAVGVQVDNSNFAVPDMGTAGSPGHNKLDRNPTAYVRNQTALQMNAILNYWGTAQANPAAVIVGPVLFNPTWNAPANLAPVINVVQPAAGVQTSTTATITWNDNDPNPADVLTVSLFYDTDGLGLDGTGIDGASAIDGANETDAWTWDVTQVPAGTYFVYATISDGLLTTASYGAGQVTVVHPDISAPTDTLAVCLIPTQKGLRTLPVSNAGQDTLIGTVQEDDGAGGGLSWLSLGTTDFSIAPGETTTVEVDFDGAGLADDVHRGWLHLLSNDPSDSLVSVPLALTIVHADLVVYPDTVDFGGVSVGDSLSRTLTLVNAGTDTLIVSGLSGLADPFAAELLDGDTAAPGDTLRVGVRASPQQRGDFADDLTIASNDAEQPSVDVPILVTGEGPALALSAAAHDFGNVALGDTASWSLTLRNGGEDTLRFTGVTPSSAALLWDSAPDFEVADQESVTVQVRFAPLAAGAAPSYLRLTHNDPAGPDSVALQGHGLAGSAAFLDTLLVFGGTVLGDTAMVTVRLHNFGDLDFDVTGSGLTGPFDLATAGAPWAVAAGDSLDLELRFVPTQGGEQSGALTLTTSGAQGAAPRLALRGTGLLPGLSWEEASEIDFGAVPLGLAEEETLRVSNPGNGAVEIDGGLTTGSRFTLLEPATLPFLIEPLDTVLVRVRFAPDSLLARVDTLALSSPWEFLPECRLPLHGRGVAPDLSLAEPEHAFGPVVPGTTETWGLVIVNAGEADATVTLAAPGSPFGLLRSGQLTVPGLGQVSAQVTFAPASLGAWSDSVVVTWSDPPVVLGAVDLTGLGAAGVLAPPVTDILADVFEADTTRTTLDVENDGGAGLSFAVLENGANSRKVQKKAPPLAAFKQAVGAAPRPGDPRWLSRAALEAAAAGLKSGPRDELPCEGEAKARGGAGAVLAGAKAADISWVNVLQPYTFVCPDSFTTTLIDLFDASLGPGVYTGYLLLLTSDAEADSTSIGIAMRVPRMRFATHDAGTIRLTVTDEGALGFVDMEQGEPYGVGLKWPAGAPSCLFHGSLWIGDGAARFSDASYDYDYAVVPGQELALTAEDPQTTQCAFTDALASSPLGVQVTQTTFAFADAPDDDYVILDFALTSTAARTGVYAGLYLDLDIGNYAQNGGGYLSATRTGYMRATDGSDSTRVGIVALGSPSPHGFRLIHNPTYVYPHNDFVDAEAFGLLSSGSFDTGVPAADDYSMVLSYGPLNLAPGRQTHVAFAVAAGGSEGTLAAAAAAARAKYPDVVTPVPDEELPTRLVLGAPYPNPFNPSLSVPVTAPAGGGTARVEIFDLRGRRVRALFAGELAAGRTVLIWDGRDDRGRACGSGSYFLRLTGGGVETIRRAVLVR